MRIHIQGLGLKVTTSEIRQAFAKWGELADCDKHGSWAYVTLEDSAGAAAMVGVLDIAGLPVTLREVPGKLKEAPGKVWARLAFTYGSIVLERGEVFSLIGARLDNRLLGLRYCMPVRDIPVACPKCAKEFALLVFLNSHACAVPKREALESKSKGFEGMS